MDPLVSNLFLKYLSRKFKFHSDGLHEDLRQSKTVSHCILLRMGSMSGKFVEKSKTHFMFNSSFAPEYRAVCEIMWKYTVQPDRRHMKIHVTRPLRIACWMIKATDMHSKYVILIAFPLQH
jgi:hypothetical protein